MILNNKLCIPLPIDQKIIDEIKKLYTVESFSDHYCRKCSLKDKRPVEQCYSCQGYNGIFKFYGFREIDGKKYLTLPIGDRKRIKRLFPEKFQVEDQRPNPPLKYPLDIVKPLYPYQEEAVNVAIQKKYGIIKSPPRSGKTVMGVALTVRLGLKTLILAHQYDLLEQFMQTFHDFTNIGEVEKFYATKLIGICRTVDDYKRYDICLSTYQTFITPDGKKRLDQIKDLFGTLIIDEVHQANATAYSLVVSSLNVRYHFGLTATPERKDGKEFIVSFLTGPIVHTVEIPTVTPTVHLIYTHLPEQNFSQWTSAIKHLSNAKKRNQLIAQLAIKKVNEGHSVLIPVVYRKHSHQLTDLINKTAGDQIAYEFNGSLSPNQRNTLLEKARNGEVNCIVAIRSMLTGINVPRWSCLIECIPIANQPKFLQEFRRITTPFDKKNPEVLFLIDEQWSLSWSCFNYCKQVLLKEGVPINEKVR